MIPDGYTITGKFDAIPNLYAEATVSYRPMLFPDLEAMRDKAGREPDDAKRVSMMIEAVANRITEIEALDLAGQPLTRTDRASLMTLPPALWERIQLAIMGRQGPDLIVGEPHENNGQTTQQFIEEQQGNSPAA